MTQFVLVHGAYHGGWCWDLIGAELEAAGHRWSAPDLPCDQPVGPSGYAAAVLRAVLPLAGAGQASGEDAHGEREKVVVVGHSLGGLTAPIVAEALGADQLVFLAAVVPEPGRAFVDATFPPELSVFWRERAGHQIVDDGLARWPEEDAMEIFFHDCPDDVAGWAVKQLRPQDSTPLREPCPLVALPGTDTRYIACTDDRTVTFASQQETADRLGVQPTVLLGGHSPFLARPRELAQVLMA